MTPRDKGSICLYGASGVGKTLVVFTALRERCFGVLTEPDGFASVESHLGFTPKHVELTDLDNPYSEALDKIEKYVKPAMKSGEFAGCVLDTGSALCDRINSALFLSGVKDARHRIPDVKAQMLDVIEHLLVLPGWFFMLCHEAEGRSYADGYVKGSPLLEGSRLVQAMPAKFSLVARVCWDYKDGKAERTLRCSVEDLDPDWVLKDRYGITYPKQPLDLRPILYRARHPDKPMKEFKPVTIRKLEGYDQMLAEEKAAKTEVDKQALGDF